jgi:hypothetical protein
MPKLFTPSDSDLMASIRACIENGERILDNTYRLEFEEPPSSRYFFIMIAQEEFAKSFVFILVSKNVIRWSNSILRAINDHSCKQLIGMIMDYMIMHWEDFEELKAVVSADFELGDRLPNDVGSAMELLRYEKIGRWGSEFWGWVEDP